MLELSQFDYSLPENLIAQKPASPRDHSKLLQINRSTGDLTDHHFFDLPSLLRAGDVLVRNNTKVLPARIIGIKPTGGNVELLLVKSLSRNLNTETWHCLSKPGLKLNQTLRFPNSALTATCLGIDGFEREVVFSMAGYELLEELEKIGTLPVPPYIHWDEQDSTSLQEHYQTTYAKIMGSVAAPTAGLHFTPEIDARLLEKGVTILEVTLHVGLGTFRSVKTIDITQHVMHTESFTLTPEVAQAINQAKTENRRVIAVGTTTIRVLESCASQNATTNELFELIPQSGETNIYIYPPHAFNIVDALITNFHQPKSTLLMLVSAFSTTPNTPHPFTSFLETPVGKAYSHAIKNQYRFFSFGDSMLIE